MLNRIHILELLEEATNKYIRALTINDLSFAEYRAEAMAYIKVLNDEVLTSKYKYLDKDKAKELLKDIRR